MKIIKCIDVVTAVTIGLEDQEAFYTANIIKCVWNWKDSNETKNLHSAKFYIDKLITEIEKE